MEPVPAALIAAGHLGVAGQTGAQAVAGIEFDAACIRQVNTKGTPALYTALDPATALREANQVGSLQPTVLVSYGADIGPIFDTRDMEALDRYDLSPQRLADPGWRARMLDGHPVPTQGFAHRLITDGFTGLLTRSFAQGATESSLNIVLWRWTGAAFIHFPYIGEI
jgi:RES domain-containing protein